MQPIFMIFFFGSSKLSRRIFLCLTYNLMYNCTPCHCTPLAFLYATDNGRIFMTFMKFII